MPKLGVLGKSRGYPIDMTGVASSSSSDLPIGSPGVVSSTFKMAVPLRISATSWRAGYFLPLNSTVKLLASPPTVYAVYSVPVGSTKNPVPQISLCSSTPWILTTALAACSKSSRTWWLIVVADCSWANSKPAPEQKTSANATSARLLEPESGLITHGDAIEHVAWRGGSVSLGVLTKTANRLRPQNLRGDRRCKVPFLLGIHRYR